MERPPPRPVHEHDGDEGHGHHDDAHADGRVLGHVLRQTGVREDVRRVVEDGIYARQLLTQLHHNANHQGPLQGPVPNQLRHGDLRKGRLKEFGLKFKMFLSERLASSVSLTLDSSF